MDRGAMGHDKARVESKAVLKVTVRWNQNIFLK